MSTNTALGPICCAQSIQASKATDVLPLGCVFACLNGLCTRLLVSVTKHVRESQHIDKDHNVLTTNNILWHTICARMQHFSVLKQHVPAASDRYLP